MSEHLAADLDEMVEALGFEVVELEQAGSKNRPILRLRIDRLDPSQEEGVTIDDCARVSRALEASLDERPSLSERYVLEVSSPGVERPLVRPRDFSRFAGEEIAVIAKRPIHGKSKRVEGTLNGLETQNGSEIIRLTTAGGEEISVPREDTKRVHLVYRWDG